MNLKPNRMWYVLSTFITGPWLGALFAWCTKHHNFPYYVLGCIFAIATLIQALKLYQIMDREPDKNEAIIGILGISLVLQCALAGVLCALSFFAIPAAYLLGL